LTRTGRNRPPIRHGFDHAATQTRPPTLQHQVRCHRLSEPPLNERIAADLRAALIALFGAGTMPPNVQPFTWADRAAAVGVAIPGSAGDTALRLRIIALSAGRIDATGDRATIRRSGR
jgi:hypothetical protein